MIPTEVPCYLNIFLNLPRKSLSLEFHQDIYYIIFGVLASVRKANRKLDSST